MQPHHVEHILDRQPEVPVTESNGCKRDSDPLQDLPDDLEATPLPPPNSPISAMTAPSHSGQRLFEECELGTPHGSELSEDELLETDYFGARTMSKALAGLGISGLSNSNTGRAFGIGLLSLNSSVGYSGKASNGIDANDLSPQQSPTTAGFNTLSNAFRNEAAYTFIDDPLHMHSLLAIPECDSMDEMDRIPAPRSQDWSHITRNALQHNRHPLQDHASNNSHRQTDFASPTLSSLLRRSATTGTEVKRVHRSGARPRATSEPRPPWRI